MLPDGAVDKDCVAQFECVEHSSQHSLGVFGTVWGMTVVPFYPMCDWCSGRVDAAKWGVLLVDGEVGWYVVYDEGVCDVPPSGVVCNAIEGSDVEVCPGKLTAFSSSEDDDSTIGEAEDGCGRSSSFVSVCSLSKYVGGGVSGEE